MELGKPIKIKVEELIVEEMALKIFDSTENTIYYQVVVTIYDHLSSLGRWN